MNPSIQLPANSTQIKNITITGRYVTVFSTGAFKISSPNLGTFQVDDADEIDFLEVGEGGLELRITNAHNDVNDIEFADSPVPVTRKKRVSLDSDTFTVDLAENQIIQEIEFPVTVEKDKYTINVDERTFNVNGDDIVYAVAKNFKVLASPTVLLGGLPANGLEFKNLNTPQNMTFTGMASDKLTLIELNEV